METTTKKTETNKDLLLASVRASLAIASMYRPEREVRAVIGAVRNGHRENHSTPRILKEIKRILDLYSVTGIQSKAFNEIIIKVSVSKWH